MGKLQRNTLARMVSGYRQQLTHKQGGLTMSNDKCRNTNDGEWMYCGVCNGRVHEPDCTSRKRKGKDCPENHSPAELEAAGYGPASEHVEQCLPTCTEKHAGGNYYVSVVDGSRVGLLAGPFPLHRIALEWVDRAKAKTEDCLLYTSPSPRDS